MDKTDIRDLIVRELKNNSFGTTDQTGNELKVVEDCDFVDIAENIVKNLPIYVVMQQRELLLAFTKHMYKQHWFKSKGWLIDEIKEFLEANNCA